MAQPSITTKAACSLEERLFAAAQHASTRSRRVLLLLQAYSLVLLVLFLNNHDLWGMRDWAHERLDVRRLARSFAEQLYPKETSNRGALCTELGAEIALGVCESDCNDLIERIHHNCRPNGVPSPSLAQSQRELRAIRLLVLRRYSLSDLEEQVKAAEAFRNENALAFPLVVTPQKVDINDAATVAGAGLSVLMFWLWLSLIHEREARNRLARANPSALEVLAIEQFFAPAASGRTPPWLRFVPHVSVALPCTLLLVLSGYNWKTGIELCSIYGPGAVYRTLSSALIMLGLCVALLALVVVELECLSRPPPSSGGSMAPSTIPDHTGNGEA
jgi:hypothetical protein